MFVAFFFFGPVCGPGPTFALLAALPLGLDVLEVGVMAVCVLRIGFVIERLARLRFVSAPLAGFGVVNVPGVNRVRENRSERVDVAADRSGCSGAHGSVPFVFGLEFLTVYSIT